MCLPELEGINLLFKGIFFFFDFIGTFSSIWHLILHYIITACCQCFQGVAVEVRSDQLGDWWFEVDIFANLEMVFCVSRLSRS